MGCHFTQASYQMCNKSRTLRKDPFVGYKFDIVPLECRHQMEEDLHKLMTTEMKSKALCFSCDMFVFSTFTGTSFSDVAKLTDKNIGINNKADKHLTFKRQKTGTECYRGNGADGLS